MTTVERLEPLDGKPTLEQAIVRQQGFRRSAGYESDQEFVLSLLRANFDDSSWPVDEIFLSPEEEEERSARELVEEDFRRYYSSASYSNSSNMRIRYVQRLGLVVIGADAPLAPSELLGVIDNFSDPERVVQCIRSDEDDDWKSSSLPP